MIKYYYKKISRFHKNISSIRYDRNGLYHRDNGPAIEREDEHKEWRINGKLHRIGGPAIECSVCSPKWRKHGKIYIPSELELKLYNKITNK